MRKITLSLSLPPLTARKIDEQPRRLIDIFDDICFAGADVGEIKRLSYELITELLVYLELLGVEEVSAGGAEENDQTKSF